MWGKYFYPSFQLPSFWLLFKSANYVYGKLSICNQENKNIFPSFSQKYLKWADWRTEDHWKLRWQSLKPWEVCHNRPVYLPLKLTNISDNYKINMVEESASVLTPPGKKMKQARLPFAPVNKQSSKFLKKNIKNHSFYFISFVLKYKTFGHNDFTKSLNDVNISVFSLTKFKRAQFWN